MMKLAFELDIPDGAINSDDGAELLSAMKEQAVLKLYSDERVTVGEASEMLGLTRVQLLDVLRRTGVGFRCGTR